MAAEHYKALGLKKRASQKEIKQAYRQLARQLHPDVTGEDPEATERFKRITEAYETLSDPKRRRAYDLFGGPDDKTFLEGLGVQELLDQVMSVFSRDGTEPVPGTDCELDARISFADAYRGVKRRIPVTLTRPCTDCAGQGRKDDLNCPVCRGRGARIQTEQLHVTFPAGTSDGTRLRLRTRGTAGKNAGPAGDLFLNVEVEPDDRFERDGDDLLTETKIRLRDALLGGTAEIALPAGGTTVISVSPGTQGGQVQKLSGRGFPSLRTGARGDLYVTLQVRIPKKLGADAHALLQELAEVVPDL